MRAYVELFAGPSLIGMPLHLLEYFDQISAPLQAGDLDARLSDPVSPRVICIADGYLEANYTIQREEIERGLAAGWAMWGVSSIGALQTVKLGNAGMRGYGFVYRLLRCYSPELNPTENIWQYLRQTYLSNRVFETWEAIVETCCHAWNSLTAETGRIRSIATRNWAQTGQ